MTTGALVVVLLLVVASIGIFLLGGYVTRAAQRKEDVAVADAAKEHMEVVWARAEEEAVARSDQEALEEARKRFATGKKKPGGI